MSNIVISGSGLFIPPHTISNDELIEAYNAYVEKFNADNAAAIEAGDVDALPSSSSEFVEKASGIKSRYVMYKEGMLDPERMAPVFKPALAGDEPETVTMAIAAGREAMEQANKKPEDIDLVIMGTTNHQRPYPSAAVEVQQKLGIKGFAYDMGIACSTMTFAMINAYAALKAGTAKCALVVNPEFASPQLNLKSRDSHFIFGDVATAVVMELEDTCTADYAFRVLDTKQMTTFSDNIRCDGNYTDHNFSGDQLPEDRPYFRQNGRKVFKELLPLVTGFITEQLGENHLEASDLKRMWLHQANLTMNMFAAKKLLGREPEANETPIVLDEFANTASAGSLIAFHRHKDGFESGEKGLICSFGAGYSVGSLLVEKI
ncbi:beta-ketodecanoyl-[acyl-carrier-protein] synthase [Thalassolituus maritimus]|uniref:Beta-ketodecanoyl-[acyl-carrier-protein] synthase n=1 Tax=Thalassolituus maritimus TaxID=484498 RepID=A0A1N7IZ71_9GAMM|nr:beta-ketoacyl-ACP synthase III [Thalassolituus maritimus]SIS42307.1 beta-ketodecanoyl-[acyl-carrier-protein] synthase [Thalassolituus maritimus]